MADKRRWHRSLHPRELSLQTTSATTSTLWLTGATVSLAASSSILTFASSTAFTVSNSAYFATTGGSVGIGTTTRGSLFSIQSIANFQTGTSTLYNNLNVQGQLKVGTGSIYLNGAATSTFTAGVQSLLFSGSGASLTSLNASNLTSGTVGTARLGSGTANSSTYLRGDGTWQTPPDNVGLTAAGNTNPSYCSASNSGSMLYTSVATVTLIGPVSATVQYKSLPTRVKKK